MPVHTNPGPRTCRRVAQSGTMSSGRWRGCISVVPSGDAFTAGPRNQAGEDSDVDACPQEMDRAVRHQDVRPARVKAVDLPLVGAVNGTRSRLLGPVGRRTLPVQQPGGGPGGAAADAR